MIQKSHPAETHLPVLNKEHHLDLYNPNLKRKQLKDKLRPQAVISNNGYIFAIPSLFK